MSDVDGLEGGGPQISQITQISSVQCRRRGVAGRRMGGWSGLEGKGSTQRREGAKIGSRGGVAQVVFLAPVAALQGIVHEGTRRDTKASFAVASGLRRGAKSRTDPEAMRG